MSVTVFNPVTTEVGKAVAVKWKRGDVVNPWLKILL